MPWTNGPLKAFHGTDAASASAIVANGVDPTKGRPTTDFGQGFYVTTSLQQAMNWALRKANYPHVRPSRRPALVYFEIDREKLAALDGLVFVMEDPDSDYWDFVAHCRAGIRGHSRPHQSYYDVVMGPVSLWRQKHTIANADQISFHTPNAGHVASQAMSPKIIDVLSFPSLSRYVNL